MATSSSICTSQIIWSITMSPLCSWGLQSPDLSLIDHLCKPTINRNQNLRNVSTPGWKYVMKNGGSSDSNVKPSTGNLVYTFFMLWWIITQWCGHNSLFPSLPGLHQLSSRIWAASVGCPTGLPHSQCCPAPLVPSEPSFKRTWGVKSDKTFRLQYICNVPEVSLSVVPIQPWCLITCSAAHVCKYPFLVHASFVLPHLWLPSSD